MESEIEKISIENFLKMPQETLFKISPNGQHIACLKPYNKRLNIFMKNLQGGEDVRITDCEDRNIESYIFANNDRIVYMKDNGGDENYRLYAVDINGEKLKEVAGFDGVRAEVVDELINDENHILISLNKRNKQLFDVYKLNIYTGQMDMIAENPGGVESWGIDHNGNVRYGEALDGVTTKVLYREDSNEDFRLILQGDYKENVIPLGFTEDNKNLILASNLGRDKYAIYEFDPIKKENIKLIYEDSEVDVQAVLISKKNGKTLGVYYINDKARYKFFDSKIEKIYKKLSEEFINDSILISGMNKDEDRIVVQVLGGSNPGTYYLYDINSGKLDKIAEVKPWINVEDMAEVKPIKYTSRDGLTIHGYLTVPKGVEVKNLPVIVVPHGGPWSRDIWTFRGDIQFLANLGYVVLQMDFRGSVGYGRKFKEAGFKQWGKTMQDDITDGVNWLIEVGIADPKRVAIYGISYGGYATLAGLAFTPDLYSCGVDVVGPSNIFTLLEALPPYWEAMRKMMYEMMGDPEVDKELLREASPLFHVDKIKKPVFVVQGAKDPRVPQSEANQIVNALRSKGVDVKYMLKENEGHGFRNEENILEMYSEVEKFLAEHMK